MNRIIYMKIVKTKKFNAIYYIKIINEVDIIYFSFCILISII